MDLKCSYCNKVYSSYQSRCNHIRRYHTNQISNNISQNSVSTSAKNQLKKMKMYINVSIVPKFINIYIAGGNTKYITN